MMEFWQRRQLCSNHLGLILPEQNIEMYFSLQPSFATHVVLFEEFLIVLAPLYKNLDVDIVHSLC